MKVIFLDIDGVLNTKKYREDSTVDYFKKPISETHMPFLEYIVKSTNAKIVLSSTWRIYWDNKKFQTDYFGEYINELFCKYNLEIFDKTPELKDRNIEINEWKKFYRGRIESFVIIDDFDFDWSEVNKKYWVKTADEIGLNEEFAKRAINILNSEKM